MSWMALILLPLTGLWAQEIPMEKDIRDLEQRIRELPRMRADTLPLIVPRQGKSDGVPRYAMPRVAPADPEMARMPNMVIADSIRFHLRIKKYDLYRQSPAGQPSDRYLREPFPEH